MSIKKLTENFKTYYRTSAEHRTGVHLFLGLVVLPAIGLSILFFIVYSFYL